jgi:hypothetical protein
MADSHTYHPALPGYNAEHVLHEGCEVCEERAAKGLEGLLYLDRDNLDYLWLRMITWNFADLPAFTTNEAEAKAMRTLYHVYVLLEHQGAPAEVLRKPPSAWWPERA